jgi:ligand-binding sensor domain-containing protein
LWVGTGDGIARYDGAQWQIFNMDDGLDSNSIGALAQGKDGIIVGTQYCAVDGCGLGLLTKNGYDPVKGFPSIEGAEGPGKLSNAVTALLAVDGTLWVGTWNGLAQFDGQTWKTYFVPDGLPGDSINSIYADPQGTIWVATSNGAATFTGQRFQPVERLKDAAVRDIQQDKDGRYWFSMDGGISKFDPASGDWQRYTQDDALPASTFYAIDIDQDGVLYFGSDGGLIRGDAKGFSTWRLPNVPEFPGFSRILPSNEPGKLWMISPDSGGHPDTLDVGSETWSMENRLPDGCVPMAAGPDGTIWCGGEAGLWVIPPDRIFSHYGKFDGLRSDLVDRLVLLPGGSAWVGTRDQGVAGFDGNGFTQILNQQASGLSSNEITALLPATDGSLWVGTSVGLDRRLPVGKWEHYRAGQPFGPQAGGVTDIAEDGAGAVWVSTSGESGVVYRYTQGKWTRISAEDPSVGLPNDEVKCITAAPDGSLWFCLYYHGAARFDGRSWQQFQVRDGLVYPDVNDIFVDTAGTVGIATTGGVSRYIP